MPDPRASASAPTPSLSTSTKIVYALGDHTVNLVLSAASLLYFKFLTDVADLRPVLAGTVVWIARAVDAVSDPAMGRISDHTTWGVGRRRGYFLLGALPFGVFFALMWADVPLQTQAAKFAYYTGIYVLVSLAMTVLSVPYMALLPEMATDYDDRTSFNTFRSAAAVLGTLGAVAMKPLAEGLGGDGGWFTAGCIVAVWLTLPWIGVFRVSFERPGYHAGAPVGVREGLSAIARHRTFRILASFFVLARIAVDLVGAMFLFFFADWLGRESDFAPTMALFLVMVVACLPAWLHFARNRDKRNIFVFGAAWWIVIQFALLAAEPAWPRSVLFAIVALAAIGYAVADLMPWSMLGDVIDEDELRSGRRREGAYVGLFTFLRKLGGASAVFLIGIVLDLAGYTTGEGFSGAQGPTALLAIRGLSTLVPALFLGLAIWVALHYPLSRAAHAQIHRQLRDRNPSR